MTDAELKIDVQKIDLENKSTQIFINITLENKAIF